MDLDDLEYLDRLGERFFEVGAVAQECEDPVPVLSPMDASIYFAGRPQLWTAFQLVVEDLHPDYPISAFGWSNHCEKMADMLP